MSDDNNTPLEFSAFDLMPDWAQESSSSNKEAKKEFKNFDNDRRPQKGKGGGGGFERRGGFKGQQGQGRRNDRNDNNRRGGGGGYRGRGGGGNYSGGRRQNNQKKPQDATIKGVTLSFEPTEEAIQSLAKHIQETARAYPVASLAKMIANQRKRYQIRLKSDPKNGGPDFYQCKGDQSVWLNKQEAVNNLLKTEAILKQYYVIEEVDLGAPKGNFNQIAVCGFSGEILGPPNHHEYQGNIVRLHREEFSNMSLDRYKSRVEIQTGEEIVAKWQEKVSKAFHYRLKSEVEVVAEAPTSSETQEVAPTEEATATANEDTPTTTEPVAEENASSEETVVAEEAAPSAESTDAAATSSDEETTEAAAEATDDTASEKPEGTVLKSLEELERHFRQNYIDEELLIAKEVVFSGNVPGKKLSYDILNLIKSEGNKMRRGFPHAIFQAVCSLLEKHGLKFFKRGKKALHVSMVRPREISRELSLTDRVQSIVSLVQEKPGIYVVDVLDATCESFKKPEVPKDKKNANNLPLELDEESTAVLGDIRWLATEGYLVEFPDTRLEIGRKPKPQQAKKNNYPYPAGVSTFTIADLRKAKGKKNKQAKKKFSANKPKQSQPQKQKAKEPELPAGVSTFIVE